jgi:putative sterol carrier protein
MQTATLATETSLRETAARDALMSQLEDLWSKLDQVLGSLPPEQWAARHGRDWTFADVPYHLAYFDRDMIAEAILRGPDLPPDEQRPIRGQAEIDTWNAPYFAAHQRGEAGTGVAQSLAEMRASRELLRRLAAGRDDADLQRPVFVRLRGWVTVAEALQTCHLHTFNHFTELLLRLQRTSPALDPQHDHLAMGTLMASFATAMDAQFAATLRRPFTVVMRFTGPGGDDWTLRVADGKLAVREGAAPGADLVMQQAPVMMVKLATGMQNPLLAMLTGQIRVRGMRAMGTFSKLFPQPGKPGRR